MKYELASELRDAGFPQTGMNYDEGGGCVMLTGPFVEGNAIEGGRVDGAAYVPILSELIEACGDEFEVLVRYEDGTWRAYRKDGAEDLQDIPSSYPEEAVARLYLTLHQKAA